MTVVIFKLGHVPDKERRSALYSPRGGPRDEIINQRLLCATLAILTRNLLCIEALVSLISEDIGQVRK